jgi:hypothetical protein
MTPTTTNTNWFTSTSTKPYDRHTYKLVFPNGKHIEFDDYEVLRSYWMQHSDSWSGVHVDIQDRTNEVVDTTVLRSSAGQGF